MTKNPRGRHHFGNEHLLMGGHY